jgi:hypothetical protein
MFGGMLYFMPPSPANRPQSELGARRRVVAIFALSIGAFGLGCILRQPKSPPAEAKRAPPAVATQFARLNHVEWANSVRDLFQIDTSLELERTLRPDPLPAGSAFSSHAATLNVDDALWRDYQRAALEIADQVSADPALLSRFAPPHGDADPTRRARGFIEALGGQMHRRPLSEEQLDEYLELFQAGYQNPGSRTAFSAGVRLVLQALLQSPHFLYRVETGEPRDGKLWLDTHELASRLSYALWDSAPDRELFERAASGELESPDVFAAEAQRLLADGRARSTSSRFHGQLFERERVLHAAPSPSRFANLSEGFGAAGARESELFIEHLIFDQNAGFRALLSSNESFVNAELARVYGLAGSFDATFTKVELDPERRRGLLSRVAFLASHATSLDPDPIHRGVFVARRVLCMNLVAPGNLPPVPPQNGRTNREAVAAHTEREGSGCAVCHKRTINPLGFPFEMFDAIGAYRALDAGFPVDAHSVVRLDGEPVEVSDAAALADALAKSPQAHSCYARHLLEFMYGRPVTPRDAELLNGLGKRSAQGDFSVKQLMIELLSSAEFRTIDLGDLK